MKINLNYRTDEPNLNNRIYKKDIFEDALNVAIDKGLPIFDNINYSEDFKNKIGEVTGFTQDDNGNIILDAKIEDKQIIDLLKDGSLIATTCGVGKIKPNGKSYEVTDIDFKNISLVQNK